MHTHTFTSKSAQLRKKKEKKKRKKTVRENKEKVYNKRKNKAKGTRQSNFMQNLASLLLLRRVDKVKCRFGLERCRTKDRKRKEGSE